MTPNATMSFSAAGMRALKNYESLRLKPYDDKNSKDKWGNPIHWDPTKPLKGKLTVGYGRVLWNPKQDWIRYGDGITEPQATQMLLEDLRRFENSIRLNVVVPLEQNEYDATVIFIFNIGLGANAPRKVSGFINSTFLARLNANDKTGAANQMLRWVYSGGQFMQGLLNRRQKERTIFLKGKY